MTERTMNMKAKKYLELKEIYDSLEKQMEKLKDDMKAEIGDDVVFETNKYTIKVPIISRDNFDTKTFKVQHPDLFNVFNKPIQYRKFNVIAKG